MTNLAAARFQMAYSLGFHMIFASLGIGMPLLMLIAEGLWLKKRDERYLRLAKTWAKATGVLFAIGAVSGTALSFELGLLWPNFMKFAGSTLGPAFTVEGYAFFMEAIFLGLYLYGWERLKPSVHWLTGLVVAISSAMSGVLVLSTNAWMQNPVGAELLATNPGAIDPVAALFKNSAWPIMTTHAVLAGYAVTSFAVAGVYAWGVLKGRVDSMRRSALAITLVVGLASAIVMPLTGDISAKSVARRQPWKLAAMEAQFETETGAPLRIGGLPNEEDQTVRFALEIPKGLSFLAFSDFNSEIKGLQEIDRSLWPNVMVTHLAFQAMIGAGTLMLLLTLLYWWLWRRHRERLTEKRWLMWLLVIGSPLGFVALEAGWVVTEVGRQPWIIYEVMRTVDAVTPANGLGPILAGFVTLYTTLAVVLAWLLNRIKHA